MYVLAFKVENMLNGSLDSIPSPSPSVKIQIMGRKVCLRWKGKTLLGDHSYITSSHFWDFWTPIPPTSACF